MLRRQIPDVIWGFLFGIFVTVVIFGATYKYLPSPWEMFSDPDAECRQTSIQTQQKSPTGEKDTGKNAAIPQNVQSNDLKNDPEAQKREYECLIAKYTESLAIFTRWLVAVTAILAIFGFCQVIISRSTAERELRAYIFVSDTGVHGQNVTIVYKNFGQTPSHQTAISLNTEFAGTPLQKVCP
jgi:hypothetical protein